MNRLEFNEVMNAVCINNPLSTTKGRYGSNEKVYHWNNLKIWFGGSYYAVIKGKIPLEVANIIYEKYPNNPYGIRIEGGCENWNPNEWGINNKYLETYHIDSKEGLLIFLIEMKDYFLRKNNLPEIEVKKYDELIAKISSEILKKINPTISAYEWMQKDEKNKDTYNASIERDKKSEFGQTFREAISTFDKSVNPFLNDSLEFKDINDYLKKVRINGTTYNFKEKNHKEDCCRLEIIDHNTGNSTTYYREPNGFSFQLLYKLENKQYLNILHYFSTSGNLESEKGEYIAINYVGDNNKKKIDIRFNITNGTIGKTYKKKTPVTKKQIKFIYDELTKAIIYASNITIENMKETPKEKKLELKK